MRLTSQFKNLVEDNFISIRSVQQYAKMLFVTPKHLAEVIKEHTGKSPRQLINDMLLLEAKVLLGSTHKTVKEIADLLRFESGSHFSHFIKNHCGSTPLQLREKS